MNLKESIVIIPARKGSKGIPGKNKKLLLGKPLIQYTIDVALELFPKEIICLSTDDPEIRIIGEKNGLSIPTLREAEYSGDNATARSLILNEIRKAKRTIRNIIYLQPTSPLRKKENLEAAMAMYSDEIDMVASVVHSKTNPNYNLYLEDQNQNLKPFSPTQVRNRQESPTFYQFNGAIYIINAESLEEKEIHEFTSIKKYVMSPFESIDIDEEFDWFLAEQILKLKNYGNMESLG